MKIYYANVSALSDEAYALVRKDTFGASDVANLVGVGFNTIDDLLAQKRNKEITQEEKEIGEKVNVRKGKDLEPLIRQKYSDYMKMVVAKPDDMYEVIPGLTVNFDGISERDGFPIEFKFVSAFANKFWRRNKETVIDLGEQGDIHYTDVTDYINQRAAYYGIPPYYYTQLQVQIMGAKTKFGDLCALFDKDWTIQIYRVPRDPYFNTCMLRLIPVYYDLLQNGSKTTPETEVLEENFQY